MDDPLMRATPPAAKGPSLFPATSQIAGQTAARVSGSRREKILARLRAEPSTLFETARALGVADHQISGVFTALSRDLWIERTGERRVKPETGCPADVWRVRGDAPAAGVPAYLDRLGYPLTLRIGPDLYDRQELLPAEGYPGIPYARRADTGGARLVVRVCWVECEGCGRPLYLVEDRDKGQGGKVYRCGTVDCGRQYKPQLVAEPGKGQALAMETH